MNPATRALVNQFVPELGRQLDSAERVQIAFSEALTAEQQAALPAIIRPGPEGFIAWSRTPAGATAIQEATQKFLEYSK